MSNKQPKRYSEEVIENIQTKDYFKLSARGDEYPSNRLKIDHIAYSGETLVKDEIKPYSGEKIRIKLQKLEVRDGATVVKMKSVGNNGYITEDETVLRLTEEEAQDLCEILTENK